MFIKFIFLILIPLNFFSILNTKAQEKISIDVVNNFDINQYEGAWYEIARLENRFEKDCAFDVKATYTIENENKVGVINSCITQDGDLKKYKGTAKFATEDKTIGHLKITFFWPFYGNYKIIMLDPKYNWAVIYGGSLDYFWILSKTPSLSKNILDSILKESKKWGFDTKNFVYASTQEYKPIE